MEGERGKKVRRKEIGKRGEGKVVEEVEKKWREKGPGNGEENYIQCM